MSDSYDTDPTTGLPSLADFTEGCFWRVEEVDDYYVVGVYLRLMEPYKRWWHRKPHLQHALSWRVGDLNGITPERIQHRAEEMMDYMYEARAKYIAANKARALLGDYPPKRLA